MDDESAKILKLIVLILFVAYALKLFFTREVVGHKGQGYTIEFPEGWTNWDELNPNKKKKKRFSMEDRKKPKTVTYVTENDIDYYSGSYAASMSVTSMKLSVSAWIEDEMGKIVEAIMMEGNRIIDRGEIKIDDVIAQWLFYENPRDDALNMEFYMITEGNMFYKIGFTSMKAKFNQYRPVFEKSKDTMLIKKGLF